MKEIITTHKNADFDALASVMAARLLYPNATAVLPNSINPNVKAFLAIHKNVFQFQHPQDIDADAVKRLIVVDTNKWQRLEVPERLKKRNGSDLDIILYDHHPGPTDLSVSHQIRGNTGATVTLLIEEIKKQRTAVTPIQATLFLAGIYEDTGHLTFPGVTAEDAYAAAFLLENGADLSILNRFLRPTYGEKQKDTLFEMIQSAQRTNVNGYKISINTQAISGHVPNLAVVVEMYRDITNVDAAFGIFVDEERNRCMVIGRSRLEELDVGSVLRSMGGGGHPSAGSALLKSVNPEAVSEWILELIKGNQQASVQISDLMSFPVFTINADTPMADAAAIMRNKGCTGLPVVEGNHLVGILSRRDFRRVKKESQLKSPAKAFMTTDIKTVSPGCSPMKAARTMVKHDIGRLPVVNDGQIIGIVTRSDVMTYFYDLLPS